MRLSIRAAKLVGSAMISAAFGTLIAGPVGAEQASPPRIFTCVDAAGKRHTSDRPIIECNAREQRLLNHDGSVKAVVPPSLTADERNEYEARERTQAANRMRQQEALRRDRNLLSRYPDPEAHEKAREQALEGVRASLRQLDARLVALALERKPLADEAEFYVGKSLPLKLKLAMDANDAAVEAQKTLIQNQQIELLRIEKLYDAELERLRKLWAGVPPGTMGSVSDAAPISEVGLRRK